VSNETKWDKPQVVDQITMAFPASVTGTLLPPRSEIPEDFQRGWFNGHPWCDVVNKWFGEGLTGDEIVAKEGIDRTAAFRQLKACMGSFEPKHEDKIAGVAFLMSKWFDLAEKRS
jgi:hypothetical protein